MGQVSLRYAGNDVSFVVKFCESVTRIGGILSDQETLAIAVFLVPSAEMSELVHVGSDYPPDSQGGLDFHQSQLSCTTENATALLATAFSLDDTAAQMIQQYQIPNAKVGRLQAEIARLYAEYQQQLEKSMWQQPAPPWQKKT